MEVSVRGAKDPLSPSFEVLRFISRELLPVERRRLEDGKRALDLPEPRTLEEAQKQLVAMRDGIRALQSLDDLGAVANKWASDAMDELFARGRRLDRQVQAAGRTR